MLVPNPFSNTIPNTDHPYIHMCVMKKSASTSPCVYMSLRPYVTTWPCLKTGIFYKARKSVGDPRLFLPNHPFRFSLPLLITYTHTRTRSQTDGYRK